MGDEQSSSRWRVVASYGVLVIIASLLVSRLGPAGLAQAQAPATESPAHLLLLIEGTVGVSREGWSLLAQSPAVVGTSLREGDYLVFSGASRAVILCADLTISEQFADGVAKCSPNPANPAFYYPDSLEWFPNTLMVMTTPDTVLPADTEGVQLAALAVDDLTALNTLLNTVTTLQFDADVDAYVRASIYARYGLYYDALNMLITQEGLQCREATIVRPTGQSAILESPTVYLRAGEWFYFTGDREASERFFTCARQLALNMSDTGNAALAAARLGDVTSDPNPFQFYQEAISGFASLQASETVDGLLILCGVRNCSDPR
jgi:hypothetical protein